MGASNNKKLWDTEASGPHSFRGSTGDYLAEAKQRTRVKSRRWQDVRWLPDEISRQANSANRRPV